MRPCRSVAQVFVGLVVVGILCLVGGTAWSSPPRGTTAPALDISDLDGNAFDPARFAGQPTILIFGELYHEGTRQACAAIERVLDDPRLAGSTVTPILIVTQDASPVDLKSQAESLGLAALILHDPQRTAFAGYRVSVMPTVVVVGTDQKVVYSVAGMMPRLGDLVTDSLLYSLGRLSIEQFEVSLHPETIASLTEEQISAGRMTQLAGQLSRRGLDDLAEEKYRESLHVWPENIEARLGLGRLHLKRGQIAEAEAQFRAVLAHHPDIIEATLGVAYVATVRGGAELTEAERLVRSVLNRDDDQPRAHYLLGIIYEQRDQMTEASASFKRSSELLLQRQDAES